LVEAGRRLADLEDGPGRRRAEPDLLVEIGRRRPELDDAVARHHRGHGEEDDDEDAGGKYRGGAALALLRRYRRELRPLARETRQRSILGLDLERARRVLRRRLVPGLPALRAAHDAAGEIG